LKSNRGEKTKVAKTLRDFPGFVSAEATFNKVQAEIIRTDKRLHEVEALLMRPVNQAPSALAAFQAESSPVAFDRSELQREYHDLERRQQFLTKALEEARQQLSRERGRASFEICAERRPLFVKEIDKALTALKQLCAANDELIRLRDELHTEDVSSGSIPVCIVPNLGGYDDPQRDGIASRFRRSLAEDFPEIRNL
jgi:hypothetical protein